MKRSARFSLLFVFAVEWGFLLLNSESLPNNEVFALKAFKKAIFDDPHSILSDWDSLNGNPCNWTGVTCSKYDNSVLALNLSHSSLKGFLAPEIGLLSFLQELILDNNFLLGTIPREICLLKSLTSLDLSVNRFSGPIPREIGNLVNLKHINLHSNGLTGDVPLELRNLKNLVELRLDRNRLRSIFSLDAVGTGHCQSPWLQVGDFSYNFFSGKIPQCLLYLPKSSFHGNCFQDKYSSLQRSSETCQTAKGHAGPRKREKPFSEVSMHQNSQQPKWLIVLEIGIGVFVIVFCVSATIAVLCKFKRKSYVSIPWKKTTSWKDQKTITIGDGEMLKGVSKFSSHDLEAACEDFSNIIGSSPDSIVYKGTTKDGLEIAVMSLCISEDQWTNYCEFYFQRKVADLARLNQENTSRLLGYCEENEPFYRMLVFEYASNGTLYEHLHYGEGNPLSWRRRMKIALGIARGLRYLHTELQPPFAISDLNSCSIYLTEEFSPKIVDLESWKISKSEKNSGCNHNGASVHPFLNIQGNTFAFGVILLEIISGRLRYCKDKGHLVDWAIDHLQHSDEIEKIADPVLKNVKPDELTVICGVINLCIEPDPSKRPSMQIISAVLENGIDISDDAFFRDSSLAWAELALSS